jgi:hypothetical protein
MMKGVSRREKGDHHEETLAHLAELAVEERNRAGGEVISKQGKS